LYFQVRYTAYRDRPLHERQTKFICALREGHTEVAFISTGFNVILSFDPHPAFNPAHRQCDYEKEPGKIHIRSPFILNGVCVRFKGYLDLERLDGVACLEFDEATANLEDAIMRDTVEAYNRRIKDFEEHTKARSRQIAAFMGHHQQQVAAALQAQAAAMGGGTGGVASSPTSTTTKPPVVTSPTNNNLINTSSSNYDSSSPVMTSLVNHSHQHHFSGTAGSQMELFEARKKQLHELSSSSIIATNTTTTAT
jgi:hypothetical protein